MRKEERLLYAMTEVEDTYLDEVELPRNTHGKVFWMKWMGVAASVAILVFFATLVPKNLVVNPPIDIESEGTMTESTHTGFDIILGGGPGLVSEEELEKHLSTAPWNEEMEVSTLPVYKNLSFYSTAGNSVYLDSETLLQMAEDIAGKLEAEIISWEYILNTGNESKTLEGITAEIDIGKITVYGNGKISISFSEGILLEDGHVFSDEASVESADETVAYLLERFSDLIQVDGLVPACYVSYDLSGNRKVAYRAVGSGVGTNHIVEHYFNQVSFYGDEEKGLTRMHFGNALAATECMGDYPVLSVEEAKKNLQDGHFISSVGTSFVKDGVFNDDTIRGVELMYLAIPAEEYHQPYYCFYVQAKEESLGYGRFYVPAIAGEDFWEKQTSYEDIVLELENYQRVAALVYVKDHQFYTIKDSVTPVKTNYFHSEILYKESIYDIEFLWCNIDGEIYTLPDDAMPEDFLVEAIADCNDRVLLRKIVPQEGSEAVFLCDLASQTCSLLVDKESLQANVINSVLVSSNIDAYIVNTEKNQNAYLYIGTECVDLKKVIQREMVSQIDAIFVEDKVIITTTDKVYGGTHSYEISCYVYDIETGTVKRTIDSMPSHSQSTQPNGVVLYGGRYATMGNASDVLVIMDVLNGTSVYTDIRFSNIVGINDASENHFVVILNTGEVFVVKKSNGKIIKRSKDNFDTKMGVSRVYKEEQLYIEKCYKGTIQVLIARMMDKVQPEFSISLPEGTRLGQKDAYPDWGVWRIDVDRYDGLQYYLYGKASDKHISAGWIETYKGDFFRNADGGPYIPWNHTLFYNHEYLGNENMYLCEVEFENYLGTECEKYGVTREDGLSYFWCLVVIDPSVSEDAPSDWVFLNQRCFTKEDVLEIAKTYQASWE